MPSFTQDVHMFRVRVLGYSIGYAARLLERLL